MKLISNDESFLGNSDFLKKASKSKTTDLRLVKNENDKCTHPPQLTEVPHLQTPAPPAQIHSTFQPVLVSLAPLSYFLYFIPAQLVEQTIWVYTYNDSKGIFYSVPSQASILTQEFCTLTKGGYFTLRHKLSHG